MKSRTYIGNDVVDLTLPETQGKYKDQRFMSRVFTAEERDYICSADNPNTMLWSLWSGKETAYKIFKKSAPETIFSLQTLQVNHAKGTVSYNGDHIHLQWVTHAQYIHCIGIERPANDKQVFVTSKVADLSDPLFDGDEQPTLSTAEQRSVHSYESLCARLLAKSLLHKHGITDVKIIRDTTKTEYGPPLLWKDNKPLPNGDVSLSHHGTRVAAAIILYPSLTSRSSATARDTCDSANASSASN